MLEKKIAKYIDNEHLLSKEDKVIIALSGGADSVALLHVMHSLGYKCEAAHCNFHLRGEESNRDETFVHELCKSMQIPLHIIHFETEKYAIENKISIEMAARELRYQWFEEIKKESAANVIAVAHHQDDSVETLLLNLIRGTGLSGLLGIRPQNKDIIRPLLCVNRQDIIEYLGSIGQNYVTDSTNLEDEYIRNKIRLNLIPLMEEINPSVKKNIIATSNYLNEIELIYNNEIENGKQRVLTKEGIRISDLLKEPAPNALLFEILHPLGFNSAQIQNILSLLLKGQTGKQLISKDGWRIIKDRNMLLIQPKENLEETPFQLIREELIYTKDFVIPREKNIACFDADKLEDTEFTIRKWRKGDTFVPFGMKGQKKISDYLTDRKLSLIQKERQYVLCQRDKIIWVIGERTDNRYRIDDKTKRVIIITMREK
ncbi:tRNA lysidine(34) synthetase TilS [Oscillospiraceae bacterium N12]|jgi:tRNA(Ile)-lysidine synthase|uniref:tRNA(Ile)-lysidine synthase n=1 Tax=Jilunia laotingensis TaxID=2763675 RepID=A0A926IQS2_9BACT|nr:tRNA lysidine(34) synthetase TilS [Jilunia laotingensis]MBC8593865.1 tRNA lysidine(34) synthetase TilS [Jilunia laotingensis]